MDLATDKFKEKEHSMSCEFPERCSCGASEFNDLLELAILLEKKYDTLLNMD